MVIKFGNKLGPGAMVCLQFHIEEVRSDSVVVLSVCRYLSFRKGDCISSPTRITHNVLVAEIFLSLKAFLYNSIQESNFENLNFSC